MKYGEDLEKVIGGMSEIVNELGDDIESRLKQFSTEVELNGAINRRSINIDAEVFFAEFLNVLFDWSLRIANFAGHNEPGVDLVSEKNSVVVQVSSRSDRAKIRESLEKTDAKYKSGGYHFYFATTRMDHEEYKSGFDKYTGGLVFDHRTNVYDLKTLIAKARESSEKVGKLAELVNRYFERKETKKTLDLTPLGEWNALNVFEFNSGAVALMGREEEMEKLRDFAAGDDSVPFRWYAIAAAGGAGKTRLAYELQNELLETGEWTSVLLTGAEAWDRVMSLDDLYPGKTLVIVDYVTPHTGQLGDLMKKLSKPGYRRTYPLRLLLLERDTRDENNQISWFESIVSADRLNIKARGPQKPMELKPLGDEAILSIIRGFAGRVSAEPEKAAAAGEKPLIPLKAGDEERILEKLKGIDSGFVRPLFAMIVTDAWLHDPDAANMSREDLLQRIIDKELGILERNTASFREKDDGALLRSCRLLWMAATVAGAGSRLSAERLFELMPKDARVITEHATEHKNSLHSRDCEPPAVLLKRAGIYDRGTVTPMLPDILGEFFVMSGMRELGGSETADLWNAAMEERDSAFEFFKRLLKDFGPMIAQKNDDEKDEYRRRLFPEDPGLDGRNTARYARLLRCLFDEPNEIAVRLLPEKSLVALAGSREGETAWNARVFNDAGSVYQDIGQYGFALGFFKKAVAASERANGKNTASTSAVYNNIANVYQAMGDYGSALKYHKKSIKIKKKALGPDHPSTATTYNNISQVYKAMGDYDKALDYMKKALGVCEKALGTDHPDTAIAYNNIALVYQDMGEFDKALEYMKKDLAISEKALGTDHPSTAVSYVNIGTLYLELEKPEEALPLFEKALGVFEAKLGPEHPDTVNAREWKEDAEALLRRSSGTPAE